MTEQKRPRGRPRTGKAMSDAEKQRAYRQRRAAAVQALQKEVEQLREQLHLEHLKNAELMSRYDELSDKLAATGAKR